jgi:hypothetical protein
VFCITALVVIVQAAKFAPKARHFVLEQRFCCLPPHRGSWSAVCVLKEQAKNLTFCCYRSTKRNP